MRIDDAMLERVIANEGESDSGPVSATGVLRLALDLRDARKELREIKDNIEDAAMEYKLHD